MATGPDERLHVAATVSRCSPAWPCPTHEHRALATRDVHRRLDEAVGPLGHMSGPLIHDEWPGPWAGLAELRRATTEPIAIFTFDRAAPDRLRPWSEYASELQAIDPRRCPGVP